MRESVVGEGDLAIAIRVVPLKKKKKKNERKGGKQLRGAIKEVPQRCCEGDRGGQ